MRMISAHNIFTAISALHLSIPQNPAAVAVAVSGTLTRTRTRTRTRTTTTRTQPLSDPVHGPFWAMTKRSVLLSAQFMGLAGFAAFPAHFPTAHKSDFIMENVRRIKSRFSAATTKDGPSARTNLDAVPFSWIPLGVQQIG